MTIGYQSAPVASFWLPKNVDPLFDGFAFVNDDLWVVFAFLGFNVAASQLSGYPRRTKSSESSKSPLVARPYAFLYYCFLCGLCALSFCIAGIVSDFGQSFLTCQKLETFSHLGFRGRIKSYIVYIAFMVKLVQLTEAIWSRRLLSRAVFFAELMLCLVGMKLDATDYIWLGGACNLPFILLSSFFSALQCSGASKEIIKPSELVAAKKRLLQLGIVCQSVFLVAHGCFTLMNAGN